MKIIPIDLYAEVKYLRSNWKDWNLVSRSEAVVRLRSARVSVATLAHIIGCSESSIRRLEVVGHLPLHLKERISAGEPAWKFIAWARAARLSRSLGLPAAN